MCMVVQSETAEDVLWFKEVYQHNGGDCSSVNLLSLFSGCGGMDIGFEGDFICLKKSINTNIHKGR